MQKIKTDLTTLMKFVNIVANIAIIIKMVHCCT